MERSYIWIYSIAEKKSETKPVAIDMQIEARFDFKFFKF